ncbi:hypothetical protein EDM80_15405 [bacterium]|nr:MAG: hypothetical protein EDM80_15405 [bacterium]RIK59442.1 MAG: hypothetical protein DCC64_15790 [Planctomycetota bacterium]
MGLSTRTAAARARSSLTLAWAGSRDAASCSIDKRARRRAPGVTGASGAGGAGTGAAAAGSALRTGEGAPRDRSESAA